ncbi:hypothetical protein [Cellulomonas flavigena]|uniref:hypothetical protein n=1 Tax=Cellulomonas flavigena TaxID=1711 RepID=UPI00019E406D|nr:hypothetical protein [Cellulomonas flavigena]
MELGVLERSPEAGDVGAIDDLVAGYLTRAERFASRAGAVRAAGDALVSASVGQWAVALGERAARLAAGLDDAAGGCRQVAEVLAGYGAALRGLERRVMVARHEVATARIRAVAARERYAAAALAGGAVSVPWAWSDVPAFPAVPAAAGELRVWQAAVQDAAAGLRAFRASCDEREELDRATAARLVGIDVMTGYAPGTAVDAVVDVPLVRALASTGAGTVTAEQAREMALWFYSLGIKISDSRHNQRDARMLSDFLDVHGDGSAVVLAALFEALGGDRTAALASGLADRPDHPSLDDASSTQLALSIRAALARGSRVWSPAQAEKFADGLFDPSNLYGHAARAIDYLFADPDGARMSAVLTVAVADRLDAYEQEHGKLASGGQKLGYRMEMTGDPGSEQRLHLDPAASVFATLGTYPQEARDWLTGGSVDWVTHAPSFDRARIDYWFGERDWSLPHSDGFAGIGGLWAGLQTSHGLLGVHQVASINDAVFANLAANPSAASTENISNLGSLRMAEAIAAQLHGLIEVGVMRDPSNRNWSWEFVPSLLVAEKTVAAAVSREDLVRVLAAATSQPAGLSRTSEALVQYEALALNAATSGASPSLALNRIAVVWGVAEGAINGANQAEYQRLSDEVRAAVGLGRMPVNLALTGVSNPIVAIGLDAAVSHLEKEIVQSMTPDLPARVSIRDPHADPIQQYFTEASATFRRTGLWDGPELRNDSELALTAISDGATFYRQYEDTAQGMHQAIVAAAARADATPRGSNG